MYIFIVGTMGWVVGVLLGLSFLITNNMMGSMVGTALAFQIVMDLGGGQVDC